MNETALDRKIQYWEDQLLDLSKRNRMISYKHTKRSTLKILSPSFEELYNKIVVDEQELTFQKPINRDSDARTYSVLELLDALSSPIEVNVGDIRAEGSSLEVQKTLKHLRSKAKLSMEEQGANILHLFFGFIEWRERGRDNWVKSPLISVPITITLPSLHAHFILKKHEDDVIVNPTLAYLFETEHGIELPDFDPDNDSLEGFMAKIEDLVEDRGWRVIRECDISLASFLKISMYNDLKRNENRLRANPLVRAFAGAGQQPESGSSLRRFDHDAVASLNEHQVLDADSSQQDAIALSRKGVSFVMQGPPGTGKSQTIANIIAQALADKKRVLFVSEKVAALDVVWKRLTDVQLSDFCLSLHSHKANKREIVQQLGRNLDLKSYRVGEDELAKLTRLDMLREQLKSYADGIHEPIMPLDMSLYEAYGLASERSALPDIALSVPDISEVSKDRLYRMSSVVSALDGARNALGPQWYKNPWRGVSCGYLSTMQKSELSRNLQNATLALSGFSRCSLETCSLSEELSLNGFEALLEIRRLAKLCHFVPPERFETGVDEEVSLAARLGEIQARIERMASDASFGFRPEVCDLDATSLLSCYSDMTTSYLVELGGSLSDEELYDQLVHVRDDLATVRRALDGIDSFIESVKRDYGVVLSDLSSVERFVSAAERHCAASRSLTVSYFRKDRASELDKLISDVERRWLALDSWRRSLMERLDKSLLDEIDVFEPLSHLVALSESRARFGLDPNLDFKGLSVASSADVSRTAAAIKGVSDDSSVAISETIGLPLPRSLGALFSQIKLIESLIDSKVPPTWKGPLSRKKARTLLVEAVSRKEKENSSLAEAKELYLEASIALDPSKLDGDVLTLLQSARKPIPSPEIIVPICANEEAELLLGEIDERKKEALRIKREIASARSSAGISGAIEEDNLLAALREYFSNEDGFAVPAAWAHQPQEVRNLITLASSQAFSLEDRRTLLLAECDESAFSVDAASMLDRFKAEHVGILKAFRQSYKQDMRQIRLVLKDARRKLSDKEAIDLLLRIRQYQEAEARYLSLSPDVAQLLGIPKYTRETNWTKTRAKFEAFQSLSTCFYSATSALRFIENGSARRMFDLLERRMETKGWFADCDSAKIMLGALFQGEETDVELIRAAIKHARTASAVFSSPADYISLLTEPSRMDNLSRALARSQEVEESRSWFEGHLGEIKASALPETIGLDGWKDSIAALDSYAAVAASTGEEETSRIAEALQDNKETASDYLMTLKELSSAACSLKNAFYVNEFSKEMLDENLYDLISAAEKSIRLSALAREACLVAATHIRLAAVDPDPCEIENYLREVIAYREERSHLLKMEESCRVAIGEDYVGQATDWSKIRENFAFAIELTDMLGDMLTDSLVKALASHSAILPQSRIFEIRDALSVSFDALGRYPGLASFGGAPTASLQTLCNSLASMEGALSAKESVESLAIAPLSVGAFLSTLKSLEALQETRRQLSDALEEAAEVMPFVEANDTTDWLEVARTLQRVFEIKQIAADSSICHEIVLWAIGGSKEIPADAFDREVDALSRAKEAIKGITAMFENAEELNARSLGKLNDRLCNCRDMVQTMDDWIDLRDCLVECEAYGLSAFASESEDVYYVPGTLKDIFLKAFYAKWIEQACASKAAVVSFRSRSQEGRIAEFRNLDERQLYINRARIRERLLSDMPSRNNARNQNDELGTLMHELGKRSRHMPLRKLFRSIPNLLLALKPCLMMSPLSVSYFLEAETYKFDLVIFDEASQIFPQDAIGAILRGSQVIIAGDTKQLPPTNFFASNTSNESDYDGDDEDFEELNFDSILEEAANCLPNMQLLWHYRSRSEELIAFSNQKIYGNNLITFPSCTTGDPDTGVEYIHVPDGIYEDRCNRGEARKIVELVARHIESHPERSLGVIAFSEKQQGVIEDEINKFRTRNPRYEHFFSEGGEEPFFVKNLENVQGDERDTIIFSICYGKNAQGRMYMRFGPLGHQGGERRLNVAVTRAKHNVKLVGSILPEDIDPARTSSEGVLLLRSYMLFAMNGAASLEKGKRKTPMYEADAFRSLVQDCLLRCGYLVRTDVGCSDYTIDMAIEDPDKPGRYLAGIECDGESYVTARTVRDRDRLRSGVLSGMGWKMHRVWSTEWIRNPEAEKTRLMAFLDEAFEDIDGEGREDAQASRGEVPQIDVKFEARFSETDSRVDPDNPYAFEEYVEASWYEAKTTRGRDDESRAADMIRWIIEVEQPIHADLLYRRMAGAFGNEKATKSVREKVDYIIRKRMRGELSFEDGFYTIAGFDGVKARRSDPDLSGRSSIEYISIEEIAVAMKAILTGAYGMEESALCSEAAAAFGFERVGAKIRRRMSEAVAYLERTDAVTVLDGKVQLR